MRPAALVTILNEVIVHSHRSIIERGGGIATIFLGRLLRQTGGQLTTIVHDRPWADPLGRQVVAEGFESNVSIVVAALTPTELTIDETPRD